MVSIECFKFKIGFDQEAWGIVWSINLHVNPPNIDFALLGAEISKKKIMRRIKDW